MNLMHDNIYQQVCTPLFLRYPTEFLMRVSSYYMSSETLGCVKKNKFITQSVGFLAAESCFSLNPQ